MQKNVYSFEKTICSKNINVRFYLFMVSKNFRLIKYLFINMLNLFLYFLNSKYKENYYNNKYKYLKDIKNLNVYIDEFANKNNFISSWYINESKENDIIITNYLEILVKQILEKKNVYGVKLDKNYGVIKTDNKKIICKNAYLMSLKDTKFINKYESLYIVKNNKLRYIDKNVDNINIHKFNLYKYLENNEVFKIFIIIIMSFIITLASLTFGSAIFDSIMYQSYLSSFKLLLLNFIPVFIVMMLVYILSNRVWVGYLTSSTIFLLISIVNKIKLFCRDDPFMFEDIALWKEALIMGGRYNYSLSIIRVLFILSLLLITFFLYRFVSKF